MTEKEEQNGIINAVTKNDVTLLKNRISNYKSSSIDFVDDNGMTPLQHACYKGNKEAVRLLLDQGADVNSGKHEYKYTALHFGALSGNCEVCIMLLEAGADPNAVNSVGRTAAQMAAFVSNHPVVPTINTFVSKKQLEEYTQVEGTATEPILPAILLDPFHKFIIQTSLHPVRIALNLQKYPALHTNCETVQKVLKLMSEREIRRPTEVNEVLSFKFHYLATIVGEVIASQKYIEERKTQGADFKSDFVELVSKKLLKEKKSGVLDFLDQFVLKCVRSFPYYECALFRQLVAQLRTKEFKGQALDVISTAVNGQRGFRDTISTCSACGLEKPAKKCSKCISVQYCDRQCQRLHWFMHKKTCARPQTATEAGAEGSSKEVDAVDTAEIQEKLQNLVSQ